jgi:hypothetical protein
MKILGLILTCALFTSCGTVPNPITPQSHLERVRVYVVETGDAVTGANVFDSESNTLMATTDANGRAAFTAHPGQVIRVVEPGYGGQQAVYTAKPYSQRSESLLGWSIKGSPIIGIAP